MGFLVHFAMDFHSSFHMGHGFQFAFCVRLQEGIPTIHELFIHSLADGFSSQFCPDAAWYTLR